MKRSTRCTRGGARECRGDAPQCTRQHLPNIEDAIFDTCHDSVAERGVGAARRDFMAHTPCDELQYLHSHLPTLVCHLCAVRVSAAILIVSCSPFHHPYSIQHAGEDAVWCVCVCATQATLASMVGKGLQVGML